MNSVLFSSNTDQWATPQDVYDELNKEFVQFFLGACLFIAPHINPL